jgi:glycerol uptake facilitator-like aquaporin
MWPWGHAAIGYLLILALTAGSERRLPTRAETVVVLVATQLPDVIDKPLAWWFEFLPGGRSLAHSLITATVLTAVVLAVTSRYDRPEFGPIFGIGYLSHLISDVPLSVYAGEFSRGTFLLWPVLPVPTYDTEPSFLGHLWAIELSGSFVLQGVVAGVVAVLVLMSLRADSDPVD